MLIELGSARLYELLTEDGQGGKESATAASTGAVKNAASSIFLRVVTNMRYDHVHVRDEESEDFCGLFSPPVPR